ncbi:1-acyl-sn-glycerol-3-phosphate acyltransferase [Bacillus sp. V3B]|uniref:lysophospholipid acyltransferase family protein n=1 Tax=Bacillus sp. V3B TaxID=2804915 RepID=UPI00210D3666|nr:lysophospholipid acyltransferase family protein [Bacillus sp. V3B]MCQ6273861.1 1-acyl-sn-glycerol-3-phosphate acyltransferase [Bacillus sp. V3B]
MNLYPLGRALVNVALSPIYQFKVIGRENVPSEGGVLLCANHIHNFDPEVVGITAPRPIHFMAKEELFSVPILGKILPHINAFPVKRGMSDRGALRKGLAVLKEEKVLGLFPEGTRSKTGEIGEGLAGAGFFALRSKAHVVPCAIIGPYKPFKRLKVVYGKPINMEEYRKNKATPEETTELIMSEIQRLITAHK